MSTTQHKLRISIFFEIQKLEFWHTFEIVAFFGIWNQQNSNDTNENNPNTIQHTFPFFEIRKLQFQGTPHRQKLFTEYRRL